MWQSGSDCSLSVFTCDRLIWMYFPTQSSAGSIHIWYILLQTNKHTTNKHMHTLSRTHINHMSHGCHSPVMFPVCVCVWENSVVARNSIASSEIFSRIFRCHLKNMKAFAFCIFIMRNLAFETSIPYHTLSLSGSQSIISYRNSKSVSITKIQLKCSTCCKSVGKVFRLIAT